MALTQALTYKGLTIPAAYYRVVFPQVDFGLTTMSFGLWAFADQTAATVRSNSFPDIALTFTNVPFSMTGGNIFDQAYAYVKTLPEFANATNVYEAGQPN